MNENNATSLADEFPDLVSELLRESATGAKETIRWFIKAIYAKGYMIINPEELNKINGMTVMAHIHGQNPFDKKSGK